MPTSLDAGSRQFGRACIAAASVLIVAWLLAVFADQPRTQADLLTSIQFRNQDQWIAPIFLAACLIRPAPLNRSWLVSDRRALLICMAVSVVICGFGHQLVFDGFNLSRDEQMVAFDSAIYRSGQLIAPVPAEWRPFGDAFNRTFLMDIGSGTAWVSAYLPINAILNAAFGSLGLIDFASPVMVAFGGYFLWLITKQLWPDSPRPRLVAVLVYFTSSQVIITGMTKFAMSAHLALNLVWLFLFLRDTPKSHLVALVVGFFAVGLHQPVFHPLFVLPFLDLLRQRGRWKLLSVYAAGYAMILAFWLAWPMYLTSLGPPSAAMSVRPPDQNFFDRAWALVKMPDVHGAWLMGCNIVRFIVWQHPLAVPLALFGIIAAWRDPFVRALAISLLLPIVLPWLLLPWQGHGWGYRYLHPALGSLFLLAAVGWHELNKRYSADLARPLVWTTAVAALILLPLHAVMANHMASPLASADRSIAAMPADVAIIDDQILDDLAVNRPDLSNKPVRFLSGGVRLDQIADLCTPRRVLFVDPPSIATPSPHQLGLKREARNAHCVVAEWRAEPLIGAYVRE